MINANLTDLNHNQILQFLGYRGQEMTPELEEQINRCAREVTASCAPKLTYAILDSGDEVVKRLTGVSVDLGTLLMGCERVVFMAATVGAGVERLLMRTEIKNMANAVIMDACAGAAIENICDNFENDLRTSLATEGKYLTDRFSPGYGDLPLDTQRMICLELLKADKRIGLTLTETNIMVPRKSVSAIMGISLRPVKRRAKDCSRCGIFRSCEIRNSGGCCHE